MRLVVTGTKGQVASALVERGAVGGAEIVAVGRPKLDLAHPETIEAALTFAEPDAIVSAAAQTAVDQAESDRVRTFAINGEGAGAIARIAAKLGVPIIHLSTDYVFDGQKSSAYLEGDATDPLGVYGQSKLAGETAVLDATNDCAILRTAWIYSPYGANFLKTMLRIAQSRSEIRVVDDQRGNPTSAWDIADAILRVAANLVRNRRDDALRGVFHLAGCGEASWAEFAETIFACAGDFGGPTAKVARITSAEYPTPAPRPKNSCLSSEKIGRVHGVAMPDWRVSTRAVVERLLTVPRI